MSVLAIRLLGCYIALSLSSLFFPGAATFGGAIAGALLLTVLYVLIRPLLDCFNFALAVCGIKKKLYGA